MQTNKVLYKTFCAKNEVPLFFNDWWLDAVAGPENWDCCIAQKGDQIQGVMPYVLQKKGVFTFIGMPKLTPYLGPWIVFQKNQNQMKQASHFKKVVFELIEALPSFSKFKQSIHTNYQNWLPFYWMNFTQTTRYTYIINPGEIEQINNNLEDKTRNIINRSKDRFVCEETEDIDLFYNMIIETFKRQGKKVPFSFKLFGNLNSILKEKEKRKILLCKDENNNIHAGSYYVWDNNMTYYLLSGSITDFSNSDARTLLIWEGIRESVSKSQTFNFEGSMHQNIEKNFRSFGAIQTPYFQIQKYNSKILQIKQVLFS